MTDADASYDAYVALFERVKTPAETPIGRSIWNVCDHEHRSVMMSTMQRRLDARPAPPTDYSATHGLVW